MVADQLERFAALTGRVEFKQAARAICQAPPGRPAFDDAAAISEALALFAEGAVKSEWQAFRRVAATMAGYRNSELSIARRLARKHSKAKQLLPPPLHLQLHSLSENACTVILTTAW